MGLTLLDWMFYILWGGFIITLILGVGEWVFFRRNNKK